MTQVKLFSGIVVYTNVTSAEIRSYLQGGSKGGTIPGYEDSAGTIKILINVHSIEYIYV
jgi:hypothetical protein